MSTLTGAVYVEQCNVAHDRLENATKLINVAMDKSTFVPGTSEWDQ